MTQSLWDRGDGGWTLDVLNIVRRLTEEKRQRAGALQDASRGSMITGKRASVVECAGPPPLSPATVGLEFTNEEVYAFAHKLEKRQPDSRKVRVSSRRLLQILRRQVQLAGEPVNGLDRVGCYNHFQG